MWLQNTPLYHWTPPEWVCNCFPQPDPDVETAALERIVAMLQALVDCVTEADTSALSAALHVGHLLVTMQGADGHWPAELNLRTGRAVGSARSAAPLPLLRRFNTMLRSTEFDPTCRRVEAGIATACALSAGCEPHQE